MNINLHIGLLILDGVNIPSGQRHLLQASVQAELTRLLAEGGLVPQLSVGSAQHHIAGPTIQLKQGSRPAELGNQIAGAVYGGIWK